MEILTEFDALQEAMKKINLDESVLPYCNGRLVNDVAFNKIQKILNCPEMVSCHKYLYNLDLDQLNEEEVDKVDKLYKLGCDRGFIIDDLTDWDADDSIDTATAKITGDIAEEPKVETPVEEPKSVAGTLFKAKVPCWTIIYSATSKDGEIKTGEAYSNAISAAAAKADVKSKLSNIGYSNITILAIESCEVDTEVATFKPTVTEVSEADKEEKKEEEKEEETSDESSEKHSSDEERTEEETEDETKDDTTDDESSEESSDDNSEEEKTEEEKSDDNSDEETEEDTEEETSDESSEEESSDDNSDEGSEDEDELDANEKAELKDKYKKTFRNTLVKCKFTKSFNDLTLEEKVKFFTQLLKAWTKNEPNEFMTDKEIEQLNNVVVNPEADED